MATCCYESIFINAEKPSFGCPSIDLTYSKGDVTEEKMIINRGLFDIQNIRLRDVNIKIANLKDDNSISNEEILQAAEYQAVSKKLKDKISFLKKKYVPVRVSVAASLKKKRRNQNSRERYIEILKSIILDQIKIQL